MSTTEPLEVSIIANIKGLLDGLAEATAGVKDASNKMEGSFGGLSKTIDNLKAPFLALAGLAAGGALFKEAVVSTVDWTKEVNKLSKVLNTTLKDASGWAVMLHTIGVSSETMDTVVSKLQARVVSNGDAFRQWGINTKDAQGGALPMAQIIENMATKYQSLGSDQEKNTMLTALAGRGWLNLLPIMKMTSERMKEAQEEAERLHLVVGPDGVAKTREYEEGMRKLGLIQKSLAIQVGNALMPVLTGLGSWLGGGGAAAVEIFAGALKVVVNAFETLSFILKTIGNVIASVLIDLFEGFTALGQAIWKAMHGDFSGAAGVMKKAAQDSKDLWKTAGKAIEDDWKGLVDGMAELWLEKQPGKEQASPKPPKLPVEDSGAQAQAEAAMQARISAAKQAYQVKKDLIEQELADRKIADAAALAMEKAGLMVEQAAEIAAVNQRIATLNKGDTDYAAKHTRLQAEKAAIVARTEHEIAELTLKGIKQKEAAEAVAAKQSVDLAKEAVKEQMALSKDSLTAQKAALDHQVAMGQITAKQEMQIRKDLAKEEGRQALQAVDAEIAAEKKGPNDPVKLKQMADQKLDIARKTDAQITALNQKAAEQQMATYHQIFGAMTSGFSSAISGLIKGTMSWGQALKSVMSSALDGIINFFVQWGLKQAETYLAGLIMGQTTNVSAATGAAAVYSVNAMSSVAAIPITGWAMAPGVGAAAYSQGLALAGLASAAGGWERIPSDQIAAVHKNEQILPAHYAEGLRNLVANQGQGGKASSGDTHVHIHAIDAKGVQALFTEHRGALITSIGKGLKDGMRPGK